MGTSVCYRQLISRGLGSLPELRNIVPKGQLVESPQTAENRQSKHGCAQSSIRCEFWNTWKLGALQNIHIAIYVGSWIRRQSLAITRFQPEIWT